MELFRNQKERLSSSVSWNTLYNITGLQGAILWLFRVDCVLLKTTQLRTDWFEL